MPRVLDFSNKLCTWVNSGRENGGSDFVAHAFANQALNTILNPGARGTYALEEQFHYAWRVEFGVGRISATVTTKSATEISQSCSLWMYDPPYADAVHYHEITEFFIAWLRKNAPSPFDEWTWDSRRPLAIQGKGEKFRTDMVDALRAMAARMPDNGLQVCMFTHKDAGVWADMAGIVWAAATSDGSLVRFNGDDVRTQEGGAMFRAPSYSSSANGLVS